MAHHLTRKLLFWWIYYRKSKCTWRRINGGLKWQLNSAFIFWWLDRCSRKRTWFPICACTCASREYTLENLEFMIPSLTSLLSVALSIKAAPQFIVIRDFLVKNIWICSAKRRDAWSHPSRLTTSMLTWHQFQLNPAPFYSSEYSMQVTDNDCRSSEPHGSSLWWASHTKTQSIRVHRSTIRYGWHLLYDMMILWQHVYNTGLGYQSVLSGEVKVGQ